MDNRFIKFNDNINLKENVGNSVPIKGHVIFRDSETKDILHEEDNLVLMRTRLWLFEQLFKTSPPETVNGIEDNSRYIGLFSIGSGGADVNANPFNPYVPKFSDLDLGQKIPFITLDPDKENDVEAQANPSIVASLTPTQKSTYFMAESQPDGTTPYYAKRFNGATNANPLGDSKGWIIDQYDGKVAFSISMTIDSSEARGTMFNEIGLWLTKYNSNTNTYLNSELATRLTFSTEILSSLSKTIDIEYIMYI